MKRILATLLAVCMVLSMLVVVPFTATAAGANEATVGYKAPVPTVAKGTYPDLATLTSDPVSGQAYEVFNADGLVKLAALINNGGANRNWLTGVTIYQTADIDMSSVANFAGISSNAGAPFKGIFDGQGYKISNLTQTVTGDCAGMFGLVMSPAVIKNVYLDSSCYFAPPTNVTRGTGSIASWLHAGTTMMNCYSAATIESANTQGGNFVGGIIGKNDGGAATMTNLTFEGTVKSATCAGGIVGLINFDGVTVKNCVNNGYVLTERANATDANVLAAAGIVARSWSTFTIENCINNGYISGISAAAILGSNGIAKTVTIKDCTNNGVYGAATQGMYSYVVAGGTVTLTNCVDNAASGYLAVAPDASKESLTNLNTLETAPTSGEYQINDIAGMEKLAAFVNAGNTLDNVTIYLTANIDMTSVANTFLIGGRNEATGTNLPFCGTFNGQGYAIQNLTQKSDATTNIQYYYGLFGLVAGDGQILNLRVMGGKLDHKSTTEPTALNGIGSVVGVLADSASVQNVFNNRMVDLPCKTHAAGIVGYVNKVLSDAANVTIDRCTNAGKLTLYSIVANGGIVGAANNGTLNVTNCVNGGEIVRWTNSGTSANGGIIGNPEGNLTLLKIDNCVNLANIISKDNSGGIVGNSAAQKVVIQNTKNFGNVLSVVNAWTGKSTAGIQLGGIIGITASAETTIENCANYGVVESEQTDNAKAINVGGIIGSYAQNAATLKISDTANYADIDVLGQHVAGFLGYTTCKIEFTNCVNYGDIKGGYQRISGFVGHANGATFTNCENYGNITAGTERVGAFVGYGNASGFALTNCNNYGAIKGTQAGGLMGLTCSATTITNCVNYGPVAGMSTNNPGLVPSSIVGQAVADVTLVNVQNYANVTTVIESNAPAAWFVGYGSADKLFTADEDSIDYSTKAQWEGYQLRVNADETVDLRLVGSINNINYNSVGFDITVSYMDGETLATKKLTKSLTTVYTELLAAGENITAPAYRGADARLFALVIEDLPTDVELTFTVTTYSLLTYDAESVDGETATFKVTL